MNEPRKYRASIVAVDLAGVEKDVEALAVLRAIAYTNRDAESPVIVTSPGGMGPHVPLAHACQGTPSDVRWYLGSELIAECPLIVRLNQ